MNSELRNHKSKILVVVGPTASGKSELAVSLAKKFGGEIISCDSRQVYRGLNLGTGKVPGKWEGLRNSFPPQAWGGLGRGRKINKDKTQNFAYKGIPHHLIDFVSPQRQYSAAIFQRRAKKIIQEILKRGKLPILCGGTAHYIDAVVYDQNLPDTPPNPKLRKTLDKLTCEELFARIVTQDPVRAASIDRHNKRRLIRALEIIHTTGKPVPSPLFSKDGTKESSFTVLWLGTNLPQVELYKKIDLRLKERLKAGMIKEVSLLHSPSKTSKVRGLSWKRLDSFGLEYRYISRYLRFLTSSPLLARRSPFWDEGGRGEVRRGYDEMITELSYAIKHYSKRQLTWWKRNKEINWINPDIKKASPLVSKFLKT